jgi:hypothetical protein
MASDAQRRASREWNKRNRKKLTDAARERYQTDPEFRERIKKYQLERYYALDDDAQATLKRKRKSKYDTDSEYRERIKRRSLERYYKNKQKKGNEDVQ